MKDPIDKQTGDLLEKKTKAQRFREKQLSEGFRQFSFWLTEKEAEQIKRTIAKLRGQ